jgi:hypothetical protein
VFQGASLWSFAQQHYLRLKTTGSRFDRTKGKLRITSEAVCVLGCALILSNLAAITDNWLHLSSSPFSTISSSQSPPSNNTLFGRQVDGPRCAKYVSSTSTSLTNVTGIRKLCGVLTDEGAMSPNAIAQAQEIWTNISTTDRIALTQDQHVILVPANLPDEIRYQATTVGVRATCERYVHATHQLPSKLLKRV